MEVTVAVRINAPTEDIWARITDIEHAGEFITAIDKIEILEKPEHSFAGFRWKETRTFFGKEATEIMTVTDSKENVFYETRAASHGYVYITTVAIRSIEDSNELSMKLRAEPESIGAKLASLLFSFIFRGTTRRAIREDLMDIKSSLQANKPRHTVT